MLAFAIAQLALAAPHAIPPADQATSPPSQQQQTPVGEGTEQKGETPTTTTQANGASAEMKPSNGAPSGATTPSQPGRTAIDTGTGGNGAAAATPMSMSEHKTRRHHVRRKHRPHAAVH
jgi:hypothetical protein